MHSVTITITPEEKRCQDADRKPRHQPRYHILLWNDDEHTFTYVIRMVRALFGHTLERSQRICEQVDTEGSAVCLTTSKEHAELKRDQIHAYGRDDRIRSCVGSMSCSIVPET